MDLFTPLQEGKASPRQYAVGTLYKSLALATERWKLEYYLEEGTGRLFDRIRDPNEQTDLYAQPEYKELRDDLVKALLTWRSDICDLEFLTRNTGGGGPVARQIASHTKAMQGSDTEKRLNQTILEITECYGNLI